MMGSYPHCRDEVVIPVFLHPGPGSLTAWLPPLSALQPEGWDLEGERPFIYCARLAMPRGRKPIQSSAACRRCGSLLKGRRMKSAQ